MTKILVVDDDKEMGRLLQTLFELEGYQVTIVRNYDEIKPALIEQQPDAVFMDVHIQDRDTIPLLAELRQETQFAHIPVVMASGLDCREACERAGANCFLIKPFLPTDLIRVVGEMLQAG